MFIFKTPRFGEVSYVLPLLRISFDEVVAW